jgi:predicted O-methyltransferase YrrM
VEYGALHRHEATFLTLTQTSVERRFDMDYCKTFEFPGDHINEWHRSLAEAGGPTGMIDIGVEGWLLPADAQKLYELAYFCGGDILELGTYRGLSGSIIGQALTASNNNGVLVSIDLDPEATRIARLNLQGRPGAGAIHLFTVEAGQAVRDLAQAKRDFNFGFIDHSHRYEHVYDVCQSLHRVLRVGAFALFHDFNDPRNASKEEVDYGVYQGALDGLRSDRFEFWGIYGCCGLFRRIGPC